MAMQIPAPLGGINTGRGIGGALEQAAADYERLAASLSTLLDELAAGRTGSHMVRHLDQHIGQERKSVAHGKLVDRSTNGVRVHLLGPFSLSVDGRELITDLPGQLGAALKFIISQGKRVTSRDALMELLWPGADPEVAARRLRVVIHTLRKHLQDVNPGESIVTTLGTGYMLNPNAALWLDVDEFERRAITAGDSTAPGISMRLSENTRKQLHSTLETSWKMIPMPTGRCSDAIHCAMLTLAYSPALQLSPSGGKTTQAA